MYMSWTICGTMQFEEQGISPRFDAHPQPVRVQGRFWLLRQRCQQVDCLAIQQLRAGHVLLRKSASHRMEMEQVILAFIYYLPSNKIKIQAASCKKDNLLIHHDFTMRYHILPMFNSHVVGGNPTPSNPGCLWLDSSPLHKAAASPPPRPARRWARRHGGCWRRDSRRDPPWSPAYVRGEPKMLREGRLGGLGSHVAGDQFGCPDTARVKNGKGYFGVTRIAKKIGSILTQDTTWYNHHCCSVGCWAARPP